MLGKVIIPIIILILLAVGVSADTTIFLDNFNEPDINTEYWSYYQSGNGSINISNGMLNISGGADAGSMGNGTSLRSVYYLNGTTSGKIGADLQLVKLDVANQFFYFGLTNHSQGKNEVTSGPPYDCGVYIWYSNANGIRIYHDGLVSFTNPSSLYTISSLDYDIHRAEIEALRGYDINGKAITTYNVYWDGVLQRTIVQNTTCNRSKLYAQFIEVASDDTYKELLADNFEFTSNDTLSPGLYPVGTWVGLGNGDLCLTGYAEYSKCALLPAGHDCTESVYCLSGECVGGKCNSPGAWDSMESFVTLSFGDDTNSLMFIAIFIIMALTGGIIFASGGSLPGVIAGAGALIITTIFFLIVGWLPAFFVFGIVLLIVLLIALILILR